MTDIDRVMELDKARTRGDEWEFLEEYYGNKVGLYIKGTQTRILDMGDNTQYYPGAGQVFGTADESFILAAPEMVSIIKELQAQLSAKIGELEQEKAWRSSDNKSLAKEIEDTREELSAKDALIQRYEFKKDDEADVRAGLFRDLTNMKAIAEKKLAEKDALIAENEWLPIETNPKKFGVAFLGWHPDYYNNEPLIGRWNDFTFDFGSSKIPTHWKKIEPPKGI